MSEFDEWFAENMAGRPLYEYEIAERAWEAAVASVTGQQCFEDMPASKEKAILDAIKEAK